MVKDGVARASTASAEWRRTKGLLLAQALGLCNGQLLRWAALGVVAGALPAVGGSAGAYDDLLALVFVAPSLLCAVPAGRLVDRCDKRRLAGRLKLLELAAVLIVGAALLLREPWLAVIGLTLLGVQTASFEPLKYAALAQLLPVHRLGAGNFSMLAGAFLALLVGAGIGRGYAGPQALPGLVAFAVILALAGYAASRAMPALAPLADGAAAEGRGERAPSASAATAWRELPASLAVAAERRHIVLALIGMAWFWLCAALLYTQVPLFMARLPGLADPWLIPLAVLAGGVVVGAALCWRVSGDGIEIGLLPVAAFVQAVVALELSLVLQRSASTTHVLIGLLLCGVCAGMFLLPLLMLLQACSAPSGRGRVMAIGTMYNGFALLLAGALSLVLADDGSSLPALFAIIALGCCAAGVKAYREAPHLTLRFLTWILVHTFYRLGTRGDENIPRSGPAVLICNHVSFVDSVLIMAAVRRPIRFVMDHRIHRTPVAGVLFRHSRTIPIATAKEDPDMKEAAFAEVAKALRNGELVGLFPEGAITHTGELSHFRYGVGRIVSETPVEVVPMALRGLWGSFFSRRYGPAMSKPSLLRWLAPVELVVGQPVPPEQGSPEYLQALVSELRGGLV